MLRRKTGAVLAAAAILASVLLPAAAQEAAKAPLSLQDCINIALKNQNDVIVAEKNVEISKSRTTQAKSAYYPQVSIDNNLFNVGSNNGLTSRRTGTALTATQNIYDGGLREANISSAKYGEMESQFGLQRTFQNVSYSVTLAYYDVLRSKHLLDVAESDVKVNQANRDLVQTRIDVGDAAQVDILPVESRLANSRVSRIVAQNAVRTSLISLQNTMGLTPTEGFDVQEAAPIEAPEMKPVGDYVQAALQNRPDVSEAQAAVGSANAAVRSSKIQLRPRPVVTGQLQKGIEGIHTNSSTMFGGISYDIFNGGANKAAYKQAEASKAIAEQRQAQVGKDIQAQVQQAYFNVTDARERVTASEVGLTAAQNNYDVQSEKYKQGLGTTLDLLNAELQVVTAQATAVQARYDYYTAMAQIEYAVGKQGGYNGQ